MNQNEQDNKPERTAMQELYELIDTIAFTSIDQGVHDVVGKEHVKSLIEQLRDTVEKEQLIRMHTEGWISCCGWEPTGNESEKKYNEIFNP